jgi:hypothetical protein
MIEARLGCTLHEAREAYGREGGGRLPKALQERRDRLDPVLVGISARGGSLAELARLLDVPERNLQKAAEKAATRGSNGRPPPHKRRPFRAAVIDGPHPI